MSRSIGYTNSISGNFSQFFPVNGDFKGKALGGGFQGYMPQQVQTTEKGSYGSNVFENIRFTLRNAWNTSYKEQFRRGAALQPESVGQLSYSKRQIITPFRAVNNAGDLLCRDSYSCGGPCQTFQSRPQIRGLRQHFGSVSKSCIPSNIYSAYQLNATVPAGACNVKFVYDSSDYTTYLKQRAMVTNYNDKSFAGNESNASQSAYRAIRRY
jgi:hypothetical protein